MNPIRSISILICTRDRAESLLKTLNSIAQCSVPSETTVELIVVDNGSQDRQMNEAIVSNCRISSVSCRYLYEPQAGKGYAYNHGLKAASGEVYLLTDDDVTLPVDWITSMCGPIWADRADVVAGGVNIGSHLARSWQTPRSRSLLSSTELLTSGKPEWVVAANLAIARRVLTKVPAFDVELGPGAIGFEDETLFAWQAREAKFRVVANLACCIEHNFSIARLCRSSLLVYFRKHGRSKAYIAHHWEHSHIDFASVRLLRAKMHWLLFLLQRPGQWFRTEGITDEETKLVHAIGFYEQYLTEQRRPKNYNKRGLVKLERGTLPKVESHERRLPA